MINLLKTFGKGLLYVIGAPFFIVALLLFGAIGLVAFIFQLIKSIIFFFTGQKFFPELPEDQKLRLMRENANKPAQSFENNDSIISPIYEQVKEEPKPEPAPIFLQREPVEPTIEETVFEDTSLENYINEESESEVPEEEIVENDEKETVLETSNEKEIVEEEMEELETYVPRSSTYSDAEDDEDNDTSTGVDINYDL